MLTLGIKYYQNMLAPEGQQSVHIEADTCSGYNFSFLASSGYNNINMGSFQNALTDQYGFPHNKASK